MQAPFEHDGIRDWCKMVNSMGGKFAIAVEFEGGNIAKLGDIDIGLNIFQNIMKTNKRKSMEWFNTDTSKLKKLKIPLSEVKQKDITVEVPYLIRHFMGEKGHYGLGECLFWEHKVPVNKLKYSNATLKKCKFLESDIAISDFIDWKNLKNCSFGTKPASNLFKINISWTKLCILIIEVGYFILGLDPDKHVRSKNTVNVIKIVPKTNNNYDSSDDFEDCPSKKVNRLNSVFRNVKDFSHIPDNTVLQVVELIPNSSEHDIYNANLSDGEFWILSVLNKEKFVKNHLEYFVVEWIQIIYV